MDKIDSNAKYTIVAKKGNKTIFEQVATRVNNNGNYDRFKTNLSLSKFIDVKLAKNDEISLGLKVEYLGTTINIDLNSTQEVVIATDKASKETFELTAKNGKAIVIKK